MTANKPLQGPVDLLNQLLNDGLDADVVIVTDDLLSADAIIQWRKFDEDDEDTWPDNKVAAGPKVVLGLSQSTQLNRKTSEGKLATLLTPHLGQYFRCEDGVVRFFLDAGNAYVDEIGEEGEDWVEPPNIYTYIMLPGEKA